MLITTEEDIKKKSLKQFWQYLQTNLSVGLLQKIIVLLGIVISTSFAAGVYTHKWFFTRGTEACIPDKIISLQGLNVEQLILLREIWNYQKTNNLSKIVISKDGFVFDDIKKEITNINLAEKASGEMGYPMHFEKVIISMPAQFLRLIPETRAGSPFVVVVPEDVGKFLDKNQVK